MITIMQTTLLNVKKDKKIEKKSIQNNDKECLFHSFSLNIHQHEEIAHNFFGKPAYPKCRQWLSPAWLICLADYKPPAKWKTSSLTLGKQEALN